jgi:aldose sugar dehydrogenase
MNARTCLPAILTILLLLPFAKGTQAQERDAQTIYSTSCIGCHGAALEGGLGTNLAKGPWKYGNTPAELAASIRKGNPEKEMPAFGGVLTDKEINDLAAYLSSKIAEAKSADTPPPAPRTQTSSPAKRVNENAVNETELHPYIVQTFVEGLKEPWSMAFLPDGSALVTERLGELRVVEKDGKLRPEPVANVPARDAQPEPGGQGGLFDIKIHPDFATNGLIYLSFADKQTAPAGFKLNMTRLIRAKLENNALTDIKDIFLAPPKNYGTNGNYGGRIALDGKGFVYLSVGDRGQRQTAEAQRLDLITGKIHRFHDDGRIPEDNPFVKTHGAIPSIWAYGVRNAQGLCFDPATGDLWENEHGMKGGDELNWIRKGLNYGWPLATRGTDYGGKPPEGTFDGKKYTAVKKLDGAEDPVWDWTPSIAVSGGNFYTGDLFPKWKGNLFVVSLASSQFIRLEIKDHTVVKQEVIWRGLGRLREVITGPDGALYVLRPDRISRLVPPSFN